LGKEPSIVKAVFPDVPLIVLLTGIVATNGKTPFHPAANACVRRFKFDPVVRLNLNTGSAPVKKALGAANIMQTPERSYHTK
jgi:hypothetical protein